MPERTSPDSSTGSAKHLSTPTTMRYKLPVIEFDLPSLTDGTDIPAPSPVAEVPTPPKTPSDNGVLKKQDNAHGMTICATSPLPSDGIPNPTVEETPVSPTESSRGSLRRLLSKSLLHHAYEEQAPGNGQGNTRPSSVATSTVTQEKKSKRASGWFKRLRLNNTAHADNGSKTLGHRSITPVPYEPVKEAKKPMGPPPPMIPELSKWNAKVDASLGEDLFKEIK